MGLYLAPHNTRQHGFELAVASDTPSTQNHVRFDLTNQLVHTVVTGKQLSQGWANSRLGGGFTPVIQQQAPSKLQETLLRHAEFLAQSGSNVVDIRKRHLDTDKVFVGLLQIIRVVTPSDDSCPEQWDHYAAVATTHPDSVFQASGNPDHFRLVSRIGMPEKIGSVSFGVTPLYSDNLLGMITPSLQNPDTETVMKLAYGESSASQAAEYLVKTAEAAGNQGAPGIATAIRML